MSCTNCNNNQAETNQNYLPDPCVTGCVDIVPGSCVNYSGAQTSCLAIASGTSLDTVIGAIDTAICMLSEDRYADYELGCLEPLGVNTESDFAEKLSVLLCQILGSESVTAPVSLSTLKNSINAISPILNSQSVITCFGTISGLSSVTSITTLLTSIQTILCDHETRIASLETNESLHGKTLVSNTDTNIDYLQNKVEAGESIAFDILNPGGDEVISIRFDFNAFVAYINANPAAKIALNAALA